MKSALQVMTVALAVSAAGSGQPSSAPRLEFDAASIKIAAPQGGHFHSQGAARGGPGTVDPALFRCTNCNLASLISRAFNL